MVIMVEKEKAVEELGGMVNSKMVKLQVDHTLDTNQILDFLFDMFEWS